MGTFEQQNAWVDARAPQYNAMDVDPCEDRHRGEIYMDDGLLDIQSSGEMHGQTGMLEPAELGRAK